VVAHGNNNEAVAEQNLRANVEQPFRARSNRNLVGGCSPSLHSAFGNMSPATMKRFIILPVLLCAALFCGCASVNQRAAGNAAPGTLVVRLTTLNGMQGSFRDARIYVDDRFVGNYEPDQMLLELPVGQHAVRVEVPRVYDRRHNPDGSTVVRTYALKGEERIEVLGGGSKQSLVFNSDNLKTREVEDDDGH
jgi:hypothetical protein